MENVDGNNTSDEAMKAKLGEACCDSTAGKWVAVAIWCSGNGNIATTNHLLEVESGRSIVCGGSVFRRRGFSSTSSPNATALRQQEEGGGNRRAGGGGFQMGLGGGTRRWC